MRVCYLPYIAISPKSSLNVPCSCGSSRHGCLIFCMMQASGPFPVLGIRGVNSSSGIYEILLRYHVSDSNVHPPMVSHLNT